MTVSLAFQLLLLVIGANVARVIAQDLLGKRWDQPIDRGHLWHDDQPVFGTAKTWRGLVSALLLTTGMAILLGMSWWFGLLFGSLAMVGDLCSSFIKRRRDMVASSHAAGLDQLPESLLPLLFSSWLLQFSIFYALILALIFMFSSLLLSPLLYRLGLRKRPY